MDASPGLGKTYRRAGVLLLIYPRMNSRSEEAEDYVVFMRRTENVEHHKGQISLPGGAQDSTDPNIVFTALREAQEELGIDPKQVQVVGTLRDVYARVSGFLITPVIGRLRGADLEAASGRLVFKPSPEEVAEIIEVPLKALHDKAIHRIETRVHDGVAYNIHYFTYGPYEIWGATGHIIDEFLASDYARD